MPRTKFNPGNPELILRSENAPRIEVFEPTFQQFANFSSYISHIYPIGKHAGISKIIPPPSWIPTADYSGILDNIITEPYLQTARQKFDGHYVSYAGYVKKRNMIFSDYLDLSQRFNKAPGTTQNLDIRTDLDLCGELSEMFDNIHKHPALYGSNQNLKNASLFDKNQNVWNLNRLPTPLLRMEKMPGVNTSFNYYSIRRSYFCPHVEDVGFPSLNLNHPYRPNLEKEGTNGVKYWYGIPESATVEFVDFMNGMFPDEFDHCPEFLQHKINMVHPFALHHAEIPYNSIKQYPGELIVTWPGDYHFGLNLDVCVNEATNFAFPGWIPVGQDIEYCNCTPKNPSTIVDITPIIQEFRPQMVEEWIADPRSKLERRFRNHYIFGLRDEEEPEAEVDDRDELLKYIPKKGAFTGKKISNWLEESFMYNEGTKMYSYMLEHFFECYLRKHRYEIPANPAATIFRLHFAEAFPDEHEWMETFNHGRGGCELRRNIAFTPVGYRRFLEVTGTDDEFAYHQTMQKDREAVQKVLNPDIDR